MVRLTPIPAQSAQSCAVLFAYSLRNRARTRVGGLRSCAVPYWGTDCAAHVKGLAGGMDEGTRGIRLRSLAADVEVIAPGLR